MDNNDSSVKSCGGTNVYEEKPFFNDIESQDDYWKKIEKLIQWIERYGGKIKKTELYFPENKEDRYEDLNYRGLRFTEDTNTKEIPIQIPYDLLITEKVMLTSSLVQKIRSGDSFFLDEDKQH